MHLPWFCGHLYSSASGMVACFLALLLGAHLVFELNIKKQQHLNDFMKERKLFRASILTYVLATKYSKEKY